MKRFVQALLLGLVSTQQIDDQIQSLYSNEDIAQKIADLAPATDMTEFSPSTGSHSYSPRPFKKLDLEGKLMHRLMRDLSESNQQFYDESVFEIENYFQLEMIKIMFDHNIQYKEFVYIFEDIFNLAEPHTERIERNLNEAEDIAIEIEDEFLEELSTEMQRSLT